MNTITATFERHGMRYNTTGVPGTPQSITTENGTPVPLSGPLFFAAADAIALAAQVNAAPCTATAAAQPAADVDTLAKAMDRVRKLLRMTEENGATPDEAANAAARAQEIVDRFKLNLADAISDDAAPIESQEPIEHFKHDPLNPKDTQLARWKGYLATALCKVNQCTCYHNSGRLVLIGRASDVQVCRYLFTWICGEIERLAAKDCRGCGITYWNNYRIGCTETIERRLLAQQRATLEKVRQEASQADAHRLSGGAVAASASSSALALVNRNAELILKRGREVELWSADEKNLGFKIRKGSNSRTRYDSDARSRGRQAGESINLSNSGRLSGGQRARLS